MSIQAVILAGGQGKRIAPLGAFKPKSMFHVNGKPLIDYVIDNLVKAQIRDIIIVTGPNRQMIMEHYGDGSDLGLNIKYTIQEEALGQANAIQTAENLITEDFFVLNANDIFDVSLLKNMIDIAQKDNASVVLAGRDVEEPWRFGVMQFKDGQLSGVIEKPKKGTEPSTIGVVGVYYFSPDIFDRINKVDNDTDDQLERAYQMLIDEEKGKHILYNGQFESYKYSWNLLDIKDIILTFITEPMISPDARIADSAVIDGNVVISEGVRIFDNAVIRGPAYLGRNCIVGNNALIWGGCSFEDNCVIGFGSEVKNSVFGTNVWLHQSYVGDSIIADNCSFGAGTVTANLRFDESTVQTSVKGEMVDTGKMKFGTVMAEGCRTGCNSVILPGNKIGHNSIVGPGVTLSEDLPPNSVAVLNRNSYSVKENKLDLIGRADRQAGHIP